MSSLLFTSLILTLLITSQSPVRFTYSLDTTELVAGAINDIKITLRNEGPGTATFLSIRLSPSTSGIAILSPPIVFRKIEPNQEVSFHVKIAVSRSTYGMIAILLMQVTYYDVYATMMFTDTFTLSFRVTKISKLEVVGVHVKGKDIIIRLRNVGPVPLCNVSLSMIADNNIVGMPLIHRLSYIDVNEVVNVTFTLTRAYEYVVLRITYNDGWIDEYGIRLPKTIHRVSIVSVVRIGDIVRVKIRNENLFDLENLTVSLKYAGVLVGIPYRITVPLIPASSEVEVEFKVSTNLNTLTVSIEYPDGYLEEENVSVIMYRRASVEIRCLFPEKRVDLGSKAEYPLWLVNKGKAGIYTLRVDGLPNSMNYRFIKDGVEIGAVYLEEGGQTLVTLEVDVPVLPINFTVGKIITFNVSVLTEDDLQAGLIALKLIPTLTRGLRAHSKAWYGGMFTAYQNIHYPGIPYSTGLIPKGSSVAAIFRLEAGEYAFLLYGRYVGSRCDLNLYLFDLDGKRIAVSANGPGKPELVILGTDRKKDILVIVANEEATSAEVGEGVILAVRVIKPPNETEVVTKEPLYQACLLIEIPSISGGMLMFRLYGGSGHLTIYRFTTNRDRMDYDPFLPGGERTVHFDNSTVINHWVSRGEEMVLLVIRTESETRIRISCTFTGRLKMTTGAYKRDIAIAVALMLTIIMALTILREERLIKLSR